MLKPEPPPGADESAVRLEPSSQVRFLVNRRWTEWVRAEALQRFDETFSWNRDLSSESRVRIEDVRVVRVKTFHRGLSLLAGITFLATAGVSALFAASADEEGSRASAVEGRIRLDSPGHLFTKRARDRENIRVIVSQEGGGTAGRVPDLFFTARGGVLIRDFAEVSAGLRVTAPDFLLRGGAPLKPSQLLLVPGGIVRVALLGHFDPEHRVAALLGAEVGADPSVTFRGLWGVRVRPWRGLSVTVLPFNPLVSLKGVAWAFTLDTGWQF